MNTPLKLREAELVLLAAATRLNMLVSAAAFAILCGALVWLATAFLLIRGGEDVGAHLQLLSVFMAGYTVTWPGAWIGLLWGLIYGAISGAILYWTYARWMRAGLLRDLAEDDGSRQFRAPTMMLSGKALGLGLGTVVALQLFLATNWLVLRGSAGEGSNAALLAHYLPGYSVSFVGSLIGAVEVFLLTYVAAHVVSFTYNRLAAARHKR